MLRSLNCSWARAMGAGALFVCCAQVDAGVPGYFLIGTEALPVGTNAFDVMPDGRLLAMRGGEILSQGTTGGGAYSTIATVDSTIFDGPFGNFGPVFVSMSPDGTRIAIGDNNAQGRVHFLSTGALSPDPSTPTPTTFVSGVPNGEAHWHDSQTLFVAGGEFGLAASVFRLDVASSGAVNSSVVVSNIDGSPAGVTTDEGFLYTGNGLANSTATSMTGEVRAIPLTSVLGSAPTPVDFETSAMPVATALSGASLGFDSLGNLIVGGGDFAGDIGSVAVVDGDAVAAALAGGPQAPGSSMQRLTPAGASDFYEARFNSVTGELLVRAFGSSTVFRYAIPSPGTTAGVAGGMALSLARRRRRRVG